MPAAAHVPELDADLARGLIARQFPDWAHLPVVPVAEGGNDNRTFRLGEELLIRLPSAAGYREAVAKEQRWLPWLAPRLPQPIPAPVALGAPDDSYPFAWSVYTWLSGRQATSAPIDAEALAYDLGRFLRTLHAIDGTDGPGPGAHNWFRGGSLAYYEGEALKAAETLADRIPRTPVLALWARARESEWTRAPVWFHGDVAVGNLLIEDGRLRAVIDFGTCGVGDPACDLVMAWTYFTGGARDAFRTTVGLDPDTWRRAQGWALWKSLITLADVDDSDPRAAEPRRVIAELVADPI